MFTTKIMKIIKEDFNNYKSQEQNNIYDTDDEIL